MSVWTCQRQIARVKCGHVNPGRKQICERCGKRRPARKRPAHMAALEIPYERYVEINGGEHCGICGAPPGRRRLDRDHDHRTGEPRGLLCWACNRQLRSWATVDWLLAAAEYLRRAAESPTGCTSEISQDGVRAVTPLGPRKDDDPRISEAVEGSQTAHRAALIEGQE